MQTLLRAELAVLAQALDPCPRQRPRAVGEPLDEPVSLQRPEVQRRSHVRMRPADRLVEHRDRHADACLGVRGVCERGHQVSEIATTDVLIVARPSPPGCGRRHAGTSPPMRLDQTSDQWWKNAVVYCLDVETYLDSDGDGIGDIPGLISRIDYLAGLGVTCLWLMPF